MSSADARDIVTVEIFGSRYPVKSDLDAEYIKRIAQYVDRKMHNAADQTRGGDTVRIAVLAALNIADEHFRLRDQRAGGSDARRLTLELEQLIDTALDGEASPPGAPEDPA